MSDENKPVVLKIGGYDISFEYEGEPLVGGPRKYKYSAYSLVPTYNGTICRNFITQRVSGENCLEELIETVEKAFMRT